MKRKWSLMPACTVGLLGLLGSSAFGGGGVEPGTVEELFERSAAAYRALPSVEIVMTTTAEIPQSKPGERVVRYLLGRGNEAVLEIEPRIRLVVTGDRVFAEYWGNRDRILSLPYEGDLEAALAAVLPESKFAGLWEPPQAALRNGKALGEVVDAFRYSARLGELSIAGFTRQPGPVYEVRFEADNGGCVARFDGSTFLLEKVEYVVKTPDSPEGYAMRLSGDFSTRGIEYDATRFDFNVGERKVVESLRDLSPPAPGVAKPPESVLSPDVIAANLMDIKGLAAAVQEKTVLLVGETHLYEEPPAYLTELLEQLADKPVNLLLEMPTNSQENIDLYLRNGDETVLDEIFTGKPVLKLQHLLRWAKANPERVAAVKAIDEPMYEIRLKRSYLADTRNVTMAEAIRDEWKAHPDRRIVVYAGQLHMMKAGRYRFNQPSRQTAGSRIVGLGVPKQEIAVVMLNGGENFHLHSVWEEPGVLAVNGEPIRVPIAYFIDYPIFGIEYADEAFDYFVNLGPLTRIEVE